MYARFIIEYLFDTTTQKSAEQMCNIGVMIDPVEQETPRNRKLEEDSLWKRKTSIGVTWDLDIWSRTSAMCPCLKMVPGTTAP